MPKWLCECAHVECREELDMQTREYTRATRHGQYVVVPGHQDPDDEIVGEKNGVMIVRPSTTDKE